MADKKVEITQDMCRQAQLMIKGGATNKEAASFLGVSPATVSRIRSANYDLFKYQQNTEARRKEEKKPSLVPDYFKKAAVEHVVPDYVEDKEHPGTYHLQLSPAISCAQKNNDQAPGQLAMNLENQEAGIYTNEMRDNAPDKQDISKTKEAFEYEFNNKMLMRFLAGKIGEITTKLDKLNDNLCQILRRMDK